MKRQSALTAILIFGTAAALSPAPAAPPGMDLWPMHVGSIWKYKTDGTLGQMNSVLTVKSTKVENGTTLVKMTNKAEGKEASVETYRLTNQGIMQLSEGKNELPIVKYPLTAGAKWNWSGTEARAGKREKATMSFAVSGPEAIKVPAGSFKAMHVKIVTITDPDGQKIKSTRDDWYAQGVGLVKQVTEAGIFTLTTELASYKLK